MGASASRATQTIEKQFETQIKNIGATQICKNKIEGDVIFKNCDGCSYTQACMLSQENSFQVLVDAITETLAENTADALAGFGISATDSDQVIRDKIMNKISNDCGRQESENIIAGNVRVEDSKNFIFNQSGDLNMDCATSNITKAIAKTQASNTSKATGASLASFLGGRGGFGSIIFYAIIFLVIIGGYKMIKNEDKKNRNNYKYNKMFYISLIIFIICLVFFIVYYTMPIKGENGADIKEYKPFGWGNGEFELYWQWYLYIPLILGTITLFTLAYSWFKYDNSEDEDEDDIDRRYNNSDISYPNIDEYEGYSTDEF